MLPFLHGKFKEKSNPPFAGSLREWFLLKLLGDCGVVNVELLLAVWRQRRRQVVRARLQTQHKTLFFYQMYLFFNIHTLKFAMTFQFCLEINSVHYQEINSVHYQDINSVQYLELNSVHYLEINFIHYLALD